MRVCVAKMDEIRIVNRAKWVLITQLKMDEAQAHHYIERQAMDYAYVAPRGSGERHKNIRKLRTAWR